MPRGLKRNHECDGITTVHDEFMHERSTKNFRNKKAKVAMLTKESKQDRRVSKRVVKAKRQLDFIYKNESKVKQKGESKTCDSNNNAQNAKSVKQRFKPPQVDISKKSAKKSKARENANNKNFDGIQVSVGDADGDEDLLDYDDDDDDVVDDEIGSMDEAGMEEEVDHSDGSCDTISPNNRNRNPIQANNIEFDNDDGDI